MLLTSNCFKRECKHFIGVEQPDGTELTERVICSAFPKAIPEDIAYGNNEHLVPLKDQKNDIVFEKEK